MVYINTLIWVILDPIGDEIIKILLTILMIGIVIFMIGYRYLLNENALIDSGALIIVKKIGDSIEHYSKIFAKLGEERRGIQKRQRTLRLGYLK